MPARSKHSATLIKTLITPVRVCVFLSPIIAWKKSEGKYRRRELFVIDYSRTETHIRKAAEIKKDEKRML